MINKSNVQKATGTSFIGVLGEPRPATTFGLWALDVLIFGLGDETGSVSAVLSLRAVLGVAVGDFL